MKHSVVTKRRAKALLLIRILEGARRIFGLAGLLLAGCTGPANATDLGAGAPPDGHKIYVAKCAKCHKFYDPARYSETEWQMWMAKMNKKAKLNPDQQASLAHYIDTTLRTPQRTNAPAPAR